MIKLNATDKSDDDGPFEREIGSFLCLVFYG